MSRAQFITPFSLESVFRGELHDEADFRSFVEHRQQSRHRSSEEWRRAWALNRFLCGFLVYTQVLPSYLNGRLKLHQPSEYFCVLDPNSKQHEERKECLRVLQMAQASEVFDLTGTTSPSLLDFVLRLSVSRPRDCEDLFLKADFRRSKRASAYSVCAATLSHLWFVTTVLGRPCCLESVVLPLRVSEYKSLSMSFPNSLFVRSPPVDWGSLCVPSGYRHECVTGLLLELWAKESHRELFPCEVYTKYKLKCTSRDYVNADCTFSQTMVMVPCYDVVFKNNIVFGRVRHDFSSLLCGKFHELLVVYHEVHQVQRRNTRRFLQVQKSLDPAGIQQKIRKGRMLDPRVESNVTAVKQMIHVMACKIWKGVYEKVRDSIAAEAAEATEATVCREFLKKHRAGEFSCAFSMHEVADVCFLFFLTLCFHRSQVVRDSLVSEYVVSRTGPGYMLSLSRAIKTSGTDCNGVAPVREFELSLSQSMMVHFIKVFGSRSPSDTLLVNERGNTMTQENLCMRFRSMGKEYLGISNLSPHAMRTFFASHAVNSGMVTSANMALFGSYIQVSAKTLSLNYVSASTETEAHVLGKRVLGDVMNCGSSNSSSSSTPAAVVQYKDASNRPNGKVLARARDGFRREMVQSVERFSGNARACFESLVNNRSTSALGDDDKWFEYSNTFFLDHDVRFFLRCISKKSKN
ncbi:FirrV-1-B4 [Feldmannia irregularis virus a]|uniref:FirrV-1-B4 n=1 Tax=Feldmannia irregularis virus a TaxID=231992 RepID=Q6XM32_9PHYC|nr:FirrV-1-B4 [Feldmannia irregularis virus a]AAR26879.1 FirrV-1-B4 [Feldmannia irregularis virus a]